MDKPSINPTPGAAEQPAKVDPRQATRSEDAYRRIKAAIIAFVLLPGEGFTETDLAERLEALFRLQLEGYVQVASRSGWNVAPVDFDELEELYDLRLVLECAAIDRLCAADPAPNLAALKAVWLVPESERKVTAAEVAALDEAFHASLVAAAGNREMAKVHAHVTDGIRIVRRLDFTQPSRIAATYDEHAQVLRALLVRRAEPAKLLLRAHIGTSKAEVRKITIHLLHDARTAVMKL